MAESNTREVGYARPTYNRALAEDNWELRFPYSSAVFAKMGREDAQVTSILRAITLPIRRATWRIDPNGAQPEIVSHVAEDLRMQVLGEDSNEPLAPRNGRVSWEKHLEQALRALQFGHMFFEQVYEPGDDGREHLVKLAPRWPGTITKINVALDGGLESIEQETTASKTVTIENPEIPVDRLVAYAYDDIGGQWTGTSVLRAAYKHWKIRDDLMRLELTTLDRNGMGVPTYTGSDIADDPVADLEAGEKIATGLRHGDASGAAIPAGSKLEIKGTSGQLVSPREAIHYHDSMMAKAVLAHFLNLEGKGGSYALAETQSDLFVQSLQTTAEWVADVATQHIVEDLVKIAFPDHDGLMPRIMFDPIASKKELAAGDLAQLVNAKIILPDKDLEEDVRRRYSLPGKRPIEEALKDNPNLGKPEPQEPDEGPSDDDAADILNNWIKHKIRGVPSA